MRYLSVEEFAGGRCSGAFNCMLYAACRHLKGRAGATEMAVQLAIQVI
jgi:hypothetical protein